MNRQVSPESKKDETGRDLYRKNSHASPAYAPPPEERRCGGMSSAHKTQKPDAGKQRDLRRVPEAEGGRSGGGMTEDRPRREAHKERHMR